MESQPQKVLTSSSLKKFLRLVIRSKAKMQKNPQTAHHLEDEIRKIKQKLKSRAEVNKKLNEIKKKEFFEEKKVEKVVLEETKDKPSITEVKMGEDVKKVNKPFDVEAKMLEQTNEKKQKIFEIKNVLLDLEKRHKVLMDDKKHDPVLVLKLEEKINLLKNRISKLEHE